MSTQPLLQEITLNVVIKQGRNLVAKDKNVLTGKKKTSDPYVQISFLGKQYGRTATINKTVTPVWNESFRVRINGHQEISNALRNNLLFYIWDDDTFSASDPMGMVEIPFKEVVTELKSNNNSQPKYYSVGKGSGESYCHNASGELEILIQVESAARALNLIPGNCHPIRGHSNIRVGLAWDYERGLQLDIDASCVAVSRSGEIMMKDTVYYGNLFNTNKSILHSGDERTGETLGDDEFITCQLRRIPSEIYALYFILSIVTPDKTFHDIKSTRVRIFDQDTQQAICQFVPATSEHAVSASMLLARLYRKDGHDDEWFLSPIEVGHPVARDFGSLIPQIKSLSRDIIPHIQVNPSERIAILRKNGVIRISDYCSDIHRSGDNSPSSLPEWLTFGLAWDLTNGRNIDLDASIICLDSNYHLKDLIYYGQLHSKDGAIIHGGDEREGDATGDDEKVKFSLHNVDPDIKYMGIIVNSFSGQELDDIARASCHLFDAQTNEDIAVYSLTNASVLDKHTALVMSCLYRSNTGEWCVVIIAEPAQGRVAQDNVDELQNFLRRNPPKDPAPVIMVESDTETEIDLSMPHYIPHNEDEEIVVLSSEEMKQYSTEQEIDLGSSTEKR